MKTLTKLLYVEVDEEVTDLVDRLRALQDEQAVTFVVPERARSLQSPMSFRLLKRYADAYGKHVNLITPDPRLQALALESGFSAYPSLSAYDAGSEVHRPQPPAGEGIEGQASTVAVVSPAVPQAPPRAQAPQTRTAEVVSAAPKPRPAQAPPRGGGPRPPTDRRLIYIGGAALALLALVAAVLFVPSADVRITVAGTPLKSDMQLIGMPNPVAGTIDHFATDVITSTQTQTAQGTATGQKQIPAIAASGSVTFTSRCDGLLCSSGTIRKGTFVDSTSGQRYSTTAAANLPYGGTAQAPIQAVNAGAAGNTDKGTVTIVEDKQLAGDVTVTNPNPIGGGADQRVATVIQQSDLDAVKQSLSSQLNPKLQDDLNSQAKGKHLVSPDQPKVDVSTDHQLGDETANFNMTMTLTGTGVIFDSGAVDKLLQDALKRKVPVGSELTADKPKLTYDVAQATSDGNVTLNGHASGYTVIVFSKPAIRSHITGRSPSSARAFMQGLPNVVDVTLRQDPFALPWLPFFSSHITIRIEEVSGTGTA
jgi:baseplate J-like protein